MENQNLRKVRGSQHRFRDRGKKLDRWARPLLLREELESSQTNSGDQEMEREPRGREEFENSIHSDSEQKYGE